MQPPRRAIINVIIIVMIGGALRWPGIFTDFWLDEIWSYDIAQKVHSVRNLLTTEAAHVDNNHPLNTLLIHVIGNVRAWEIYRIPSLMLGIASIALASFIMRRRGHTEIIVAAIAIAFSYPLLFYSSEARGYSMVVFFALLAMESLLTFVERPTWKSAAIFNLACILGFLSHLTFVHFYFAAVIWSLFAIRRSVPTIQKQIVLWTKLNLVPIVFCLFLYRIFVRGITIGGAADRDPLSVIVESLSVPFNGPGNGIIAMIVACLAILIFIAGVTTLAWQRDRLALFYVLAILIAPTFFLAYDLLLSAHPQPLMLRYFLIPITLLLLCGVHVAGAMWRTAPPGRVMVIVLLSCFVISGLVKTWDFLQFGRGGYSRAIARMFAVSPDQRVTVDADNEFASGRIVDFYAPRLAPPGRSIDFRHDRAAATQASHPPEWVIISDSRRVQRKSKETTSVNNEVYRLDSEYPCFSLSGAPWLLYRIDIEATLRNQRSSSSKPAEQN